MNISEKFVPNDTLVKWRGIFLYIWGRFIWSLGKFRPKKFNLCTFLQIGAKRAGRHDGAAAQAQAHEGTNRLVFDLHRTLSWGFFRCLRVVPSLPPAAQAPGGSSGAVASPAGTAEASAGDGRPGGAAGRAQPGRVRPRRRAHRRLLQAHPQDRRGHLRVSEAEPKSPSGTRLAG